MDNFNIMVVDDNEDIHELLQMFLAECSLFQGKNVVFHSAFQGQDAVALLEKQKNAGDPIHFIFMDFVMPPGINGLETMELIMKIDKDVPFIFCSAYSTVSPEDIQTKLGVNGNIPWLSKPFGFNDLETSIKNLI